MAQCVTRRAPICSNAYGGWFAPLPWHSVRITYRPSAALWLLGSLSHNKFLRANKFILILIKMLHSITMFCRCAAGFYGDPRPGSATGCRPCMCPGGAGSNFQHGDSCRLNTRTNDVICDCQPGYTGNVKSKSQNSGLIVPYRFHRFQSL